MVFLMKFRFLAKLYVFVVVYLLLDTKLLIYVINLKVLASKYFVLVYQYLFRNVSILRDSSLSSVKTTAVINTPGKASIL